MVPPAISRSSQAAGYPQKTIFDSLHENGLDFGIYYQNIPATIFQKSEDVEIIFLSVTTHGGFRDHVKTPYGDVPNPDGNTGPAPSFFKFDRLGVRVPTIMVFLGSRKEL
ncbi:hypothetical protein HAX54_051425 [Datura stramonium]|uniref:Uncharacterized protein n=1 Tax=Datura stramonium TaxID=4076 RepID=A0ABS8WPU7_DATST|nr:hypothetical protein [Datura stramonium]